MHFLSKMLLCADIDALCRLLPELRSIRQHKIYHAAVLGFCQMSGERGGKRFEPSETRRGEIGLTVYFDRYSVKALSFWFRLRPWLYD